MISGKYCRKQNVPCHGYLNLILYSYATDLTKRKQRVISQVLSVSEKNFIYIKKKSLKMKVDILKEALNFFCRPKVVPLKITWSKFWAYKRRGIFIYVGDLLYPPQLPPSQIENQQRHYSFASKPILSDRAW